MKLSEKAPPILRQISVRAVMDVLLNRGPRSRADLAKDTNLSKQTMSEVIKAVQNEGWVRENGTTSGHVGRTAILYEVNADAGFVIGVDIATSALRFAIRDISGNERGTKKHASVHTGGPDLVDRIAAHAEDLIKSCGLPRDRLLGCALATPGAINPKTGRLGMVPNFKSLMDVDLVSDVRQRLNCDVILENDVNAAALGECWLGAANEAHTAAFVYIGEGLGVGVTVEGSLLRGATGAAGEVGYLPFGAAISDPQSLEQGALERALGTQGLIDCYNANGPDRPVASAEDLVRALSGRSEAANRTLQTIGQIGALLIVSVHSMHDPSVIVMGGKTGQLSAVQTAIKEELSKVTVQSLKIIPSELKDYASVTGATALALKKLQSALFEPEFSPKRRPLPPLPAQR